MSYSLSISNASDPCLLSYDFTTNPDPIQASLKGGNPSLTSIVVTVSNNTPNTIYCKQLQFSFSIGPNAQNLTNIATGILIAANNSDSWQISQTTDGVFTATPKKEKDREITTDGLSFQIYNIQPNDQVGTFDFYVEENSSSDNKTYSERNNTYKLTKFPYGFYVDNFAASHPMVQNGRAVTLTWVGSDLATYTMLYDDACHDVTNIRSWTSPALSNTTTFILKASAQQSGETVDDYLSVTVVVANPELSATSLKVLQTSNLKGATTLGSTLSVAGETTAANMTVNELNVHGNIAGGNTTKPFHLKNGKNNDPSLISSNASWLRLGANQGIGLWANGQTEQNDNPQVFLQSNGTFQCNGGVQIGGEFQSQGSVKMLGNSQSIKAGTYQAPTDGFVIGMVGSSGSASNMSYAQVFCTSNGVTCQATGGTIVFWIRGDMQVAAQNVNTNSFTMPISNGAWFTTSVWSPSSWNNNPPPVNFYWIPQGKGNVNVTALSKAEIAELGIELPEEPAMFESVEVKLGE